jgi:hypothetical protein
VIEGSCGDVEWLTSAVVAFGLIVGFGHLPDRGAAQPKRAAAENVEQEIRSMTNRERVHRNLAALKLDRACAQAIAGQLPRRPLDAI